MCYEELGTKQRVDPRNTVLLLIGTFIASELSAGGIGIRFGLVGLDASGKFFTGILRLAIGDLVARMLLGGSTSLDKGRSNKCGQGEAAGGHSNHLGYSR